VNPSPHLEAAEQLAANRLTGGRLRALPTSCRPVDQAGAYAIQAALHPLLAEAHASAYPGHKIGCTTAIMQAYLGIETPCAGGILAADVHRLHGRVATPGATRLGAECEIAVRLGADLADGAFDPVGVGRAVAALMCAIEIVEDRYVDYRILDTPTLIADDFFNRGCVLGAEVEDWGGLDLERIAGVMRVNRREVGRGNGADILGHPFAALAWLAGLKAGQRTPLRKDDFVLLGSLVQTVWLVPGDRVEVEIEGLGLVSLDVG
jgi:2-oxo-3-hexenedioate decarboxylase/2-keto-4-pentenoate hydratase